MLAGGAQAWAATACVLAGIPPGVTMRIVGHEDHQTTVKIDTRIQGQQLQESTADLARVLESVSVPAFGPFD